MLKRHFAIVSNCSSASAVLVRALRGAGVAAFGELLHRDGVVREADAFDAVRPIREGEDGAEYLRSHYSQGTEPRGLCILYDQARRGSALTAWDYLIEHREIAVIHLVRRDLLATRVASELAARTRSPAHVGGGSVPPFDLDVEQLARYFDAFVARRDWVRRAFRGNPFLELRYEDQFRERPREELGRILAHLGFESEPAIGTLPTPKTRGPVEEQVANFAEIRDYFRHTPHAVWFEARPAPGRTGSHPGFCPRPFEFFAVDAEGKLRVCCEDWLPTPIGDVRSGSPRDQWNSPMAIAVRESILDGSYRFCDQNRCPDLVKGTLLPIEKLSRRQHRKWCDDGSTVLEEPPQMLSLGYDPTCNLKCPTCRSDFVFLRGPALDRASAIHEVVLSELLPTARQALITGHGDAIASPLYREFLRNFDKSRFPQLRILLMTNGLALNQKMWESFEPAHGAIAGVSVSIDAATPETYALNRGGNFDRLMRNLEFLGGLCRNGELEFFEVSFVVQTNNFREMPAFVAMARECGCTGILFMKLIHWDGTYDAVEYAERAVHEPAHAMHRELLRVIADPIFAERGVDLSNLSDLRPTRESERAG